MSCLYPPKDESKGIGGLACEDGHYSLLNIADQYTYALNVYSIYLIQKIEHLCQLFIYILDEGFESLLLSYLGRGIFHQEKK